MGIYEKKRKRKWILYGSAAMIFLLIMCYSYMLVSNVAKEEKHRVKIWADAIAYRAKLMNHTEQFFNKIGLEEEKKIALFTRAYMEIKNAPLGADITFLLDVILSNTSIPAILVTENDNIDACINMDSAISSKKFIWEIPNSKTNYSILPLRFAEGRYVTVYYQESKIYSDLRKVLHNLVESFFQEVVANTASMPVVVIDSSTLQLITYSNLKEEEVNVPENLASLLNLMRSQNEPIKIDLLDEHAYYVYYKDSSMLQQLRFFPFLQFIVILIFVIIAYLFFSMDRRSEQNRVWVGMSKETAHQLGTPISSLMAWTALLQDQGVDETLVKEMNKDVNRLETIAQRFSKIGSLPELKKENLVEIINDFCQYLKNRISAKVFLEFIKPKEISIPIMLNRYLFEWVIENLVKNSVDAMGGEGLILIRIIPENKVVHIDIQDNGKGIPAKLQKQIFNPGYTSKSRGWGLGLTLAKRIVKEYHKGKLFVKSSTPNVGTVMRITLTLSRIV